jgi:methyl-accepting chemotaxis protein
MTPEQIQAILDSQLEFNRQIQASQQRTDEQLGNFVTTSDERFRQIQASQQRTDEQLGGFITRSNERFASLEHMLQAGFEDVVSMIGSLAEVSEQAAQERSEIRATIVRLDRIVLELQASHQHQTAIITRLDNIIEGMV